MKFGNLNALILLFCIMSGGCVSDSDANSLTPTEEEIVIAHVRRFVLHAKKVRLNQEERNIIQNKKPELHIRYTGPKTGRLSIRWTLPSYRIILLQRSGNLLSSEKADWSIRIISDQTSGKIPLNFYGAHGEDISLPPK